MHQCTVVLPRVVLLAQYVPLFVCTMNIHCSVTMQYAVSTTIAKDACMIAHAIAEVVFCVGGHHHISYA